MAIELQCRCGWGNSFDDAQQGLSLNCPECNREILVTSDAAEFMNRNVNDDDFAFAADDEDDEPIVEAPQQAAPKRPLPGRARTSGKPRPAGKTRAPGKRNAKVQSWDHDRRSSARGRVSVVQKNWAAHPAVLAAIFLAILGVGYLAYSAMTRSGGMEKAAVTAQNAAEALKNQNFTAAREFFVNKKVLDALAAQFSGLVSDEVIFQSKRIRGGVASDGETYRAIYRLDHGDRAYRLSLHVGAEPGVWKVVKSNFRELSAGERAKE